MFYNWLRGSKNTILLYLITLYNGVSLGMAEFKRILNIISKYYRASDIL